ncbi:MAG: glycosyltransferase family 39 protein [Lachnospiraceae bacterium]|nr:glycosyltransferase family 39 protein [Lachnospiraceae bacterium]
MDKVELFGVNVTIFGSYLYFITEILSVFRKLNFYYILFAWLVYFFIWIGVFIIKRNLYQATFADRCLDLEPQTGRRQIAVVVLILFVFHILLAVRTVPYNWDSMTYHLPRIVHWIQNGSIAHYATNCVRQVGSPVYAEIVSLHVYLLCGSEDWSIPLVQCISHEINTILIYYISRRIGCSRPWGIIAAGMYFSMPIAFAESLSTQNDVVAAMWLLLLVYFLLPYLQHKDDLVWNKQLFIRVSCSAAALGMGYLTKPSVCPAMFVAVLVLIESVRGKKKWGIILASVCWAIFLAFLYVMPELWRNIKTFSAFAPASVGARQLVGTLKPDMVFFNFLKNLVYNLPLPFLEFVGKAAEKFVRAISWRVGVYLDDPSISEDGRMFSMTSGLDFGHDTAINALVVWGFLVICALLLIKRVQNIRQGGLKKGRTFLTPESRSYSFIAISSFLLFLFLVRWEPFETRYEIPYLAMLCACISLVFQEVSNGFAIDRSEGNKRKKRNRIGVVIWGILILGFLNLEVRYHAEIAFREGGSRPEGYFFYGGYAEYDSAAKEIRERGDKKLGLMLGEDSFEYQIWVLLDGEIQDIRHVNVSNETKIYEDINYVPDCILIEGHRDSLSCHGYDYTAVFQNDRFSLLQLNEG